MAKPHGDLASFQATVPARDATLVRHGRVAASFFRRLRGLLGTNELVLGDGLLITPCSSVHMLGMRYPIDVLYLDAKDCVVGVDHSLAPGRLGGFYRGARYVIELPPGVCSQIGVSVGDQVLVREVEACAPKA